MDNLNIKEELVNLLIEKKLHITTAESCTGGLLSSSIVDVANASKVFDEAYVTYANEAKVKLLNVNPRTIEEYGVVSEEVAREMAIGARASSNADIALSTSGIAGPSGGTDKKPVGMVCFGIAYKEMVYSYTKYFGNIGRENVRKASVEFAIKKVIEILQL